MSIKKYPIPKGFESDGCTFAPDLNFKACCIEHDYLRRYKVLPKKEADAHLKNCIKESGHPVLAWVYYFFVRIGGFFYD